MPAPPVYRPFPPRTVAQPKIAAPPPVYRPHQPSPPAPALRGPARPVVQRRVQGGIIGFQDLINRIEEPFRSALTSNRQTRDQAVDVLDLPDEMPMDQIRDIAIQNGFRHHWVIGICNGTIEVNANRSWADFHVTGEMGGSLRRDVLIERLTFIGDTFATAQRFSLVEGELELHPTGAVVTKQLITLLAQACGKTGWSYLAAVAQMKKRKFGTQPDRNKLAPKIDDDLLPEYFNFLASLKGVAGVRVIPTGAMPLPQGIRQMNEQQQVAALEENMLDDSASSNRRFTQYRQTYEAAQGDAVPSMRVHIRARHIAALLGVLRTV